MGINEVLFGIQIVVVTSFGIFFASKGKNWLTGWLSLLSIIMNIFVLKQVRLGLLDVTAADVYMTGLLTSLNYARELYDCESVNEAVLGSWAITIAFLILSQLHLSLIPSVYDTTQKHFQALFSPTPRLIVASLVTMMIVQTVDGKLFTWSQKFFQYRYFGIRNILSLLVSQMIDTLMFSFLGLYGIITNLAHVMFLALLMKWCAIILSCPVIAFIGRSYSRKIIFKEDHR
ncbi:queuosine precursor transporter [Chlamydia sp. 17-3921]|uniref:queuosine precursor transporter n=1 Tax=Chlamydia sp. 17-3921 TaxID=2675798 RepID=UPI001919B80F|nr:queuosine precursor transporter [Chlamydia sp. 17-3921]